MGDYNTEIPWKPTELVTIIPAYDDQPARVAWNGAGIVSTEFARQFARDLLAKCDLVDQENMVDT